LSPLLLPLSVRVLLPDEGFIKLVKISGPVPEDSIVLIAPLMTAGARRMTS
jgi:hypothetical protein